MLPLQIQHVINNHFERTGNTLTMAHNHPDEQTFSPKDMESLFINRLYKIVVVTPTRKFTAELDQRVGPRKKKKIVRELVKTVEDATFGIHAPEIRKGRTVSEFVMQESHPALMKAAENIKEFSYKMEPIKHSKTATSTKKKKNAVSEKKTTKAKTTTKKKTAKAKTTTKKKASKKKYSSVKGTTKRTAKKKSAEKVRYEALLKKYSRNPKRMTEEEKDEFATLFKKYG